jgi:hypothetical protein
VSITSISSAGLLKDHPSAIHRAIAAIAIFSPRNTNCSFIMMDIALHDAGGPVMAFGGF